MTPTMMFGGAVVAALGGFLGAHLYETYVGGLRRCCRR
jgi:hypothetical protein